MAINPLITHSDLIKVGANWLKKQHGGWDNKYKKDRGYYHSSCGVILTEFKSFEVSIPDVIGFNNYCSVVIECKVSHSDYLADLKKSHRFALNPKQCGNYRYYLTLPDVIKIDEVNNGWGLLYYDGKVSVVKPPTLHTESEIKVAEYSILYSIARRASDKKLLDKIIAPYAECCVCNHNVDDWVRDEVYHKNFCKSCWSKIKGE